MPWASSTSGEYAARLLARNFEKLEDLYHLKPEQVLEIKQVGEKLAASLVKFFNDKENLQTLTTLQELGSFAVEPGLRRRTRKETRAPRRDDDRHNRDRSRGPARNWRT